DPRAGEAFDAGCLTGVLMPLPEEGMRLRSLVLVVSTVSVLAAAASPILAAEPVAAAPHRSAYFGDLHMHTMYSFDAFLANARVTPDDAYRYAQGEPIRLTSGETARLSGPPLVFLAVTDHSEF